MALNLQPEQPRVRNPIAAVIDTDPGIDDALALFIACASPEFDILGVTACAGNAGLSIATGNALKILALCGRDGIPVIPGADKPLRRPPIEAGVIHSADGLGGLAFPEATASALAGGAAAWLARLLGRRPPHTVTVLALGPLTNIAQLIEAAPAAAKRIGSIAAMGGAVRGPGNVTPYAEFNIAADPEAAEIVFRSGIPVTLAPLDVTRQVAADRAWCAGLAASAGGAAKSAAAMAGVYMRNVSRWRLAKGIPASEAEISAIPLHDPCVMLHALDASLFKAEALPLSVDCSTGERAGQTFIDADHGAEVTVLTAADAPRALALAAERIARLL